MSTRRHFIQLAGTGVLGLQTGLKNNLFAFSPLKTEVDAHLWVYASRYPPDWDCTPILDDIFSDIKYAGYSGLELMEIILRHDDSVNRLNDLRHKHKLRISGTSYNGDMWNRDERQKILEDVELVAEKLNKVGGEMIGISVGNAERKKTEEELDNQAAVLKGIIAICRKNNIEPNLHNHTYEMDYDMFDFKGNIERVPEIKLGPDLNWLVRAKVDPVWFIKTYGHKMVYMHLRDQYANGKWTEAMGEGITDFKAIAKALHDIGYKGKAAVELAFDAPPVRPVKESWKKSREFVHTTFGW